MDLDIIVTVAAHQLKWQLAVAFAALMAWFSKGQRPARAFISAAHAPWLRPLLESPPSALTDANVTLSFLLHGIVRLQMFGIQQVYTRIQRGLDILLPPATIGIAELPPTLPCRAGLLLYHITELCLYKYGLRIFCLELEQHLPIRQRTEMEDGRDWVWIVSMQWIECLLCYFSLEGNKTLLLASTYGAGRR